MSSLPLQKFPIYIFKAADKPSVIYAVTEGEGEQTTCVGLQRFNVCICGVRLVISKDFLNNQGSWLTFRSTEAYTKHSTMLSLGLIN